MVVSGKPNPSITWLFDGDKLTSDYAIEIQGDGSISIPTVGLKHGGIYKMEAKNAAGSAVKQVQLIVTLKGEDVSEVERKVMEFCPIPMAEFGDYVATNHKYQNQGFRDEFQVTI